MSPEYFERLIHNCTEEFSKFNPHADPAAFINNMGSLMALLHTVNAPITTVEFIEALRACANILEIVHGEGMKQ